MKTNLAGKSNAVLTESDYGVIAIIACKGGKDKDISKQVKQAISEHLSLEKGTEITFSDTEVITNQGVLNFEASFIEDGDDTTRDFTLEVTVTY